LENISKLFSNGRQKRQTSVT